MYGFWHLLALLLLGAFEGGQSLGDDGKAFLAGTPGGQAAARICSAALS